MRNFLTFAALAATTAFATPAFAQVSGPRVEIESRALILQPATITAGAPLNFGTVVASALPGVVTLDAATGAASDDGEGATYVSGASRGTFQGNGEPRKQVEVVVTADPLLTKSGSTAYLDYSLASSGDGVFAIRPDGLFTVFVGGSIVVKANQEPGLYTGKVYVTADFQ
jgi:hypothetical protein